MTKLFTAGYQGHSIETFLDLLAGHGVAHVIDVRQLPFSRKPDFSKKRLAAHLAAASIGYTHLVALGTPKPLRDEVRRSHDFPAFFAAMDALVAAQPEALAEALAIARAQPSALLCFEANPHECHRLSVASALERIAGAALEVVHL
ncbi:MAG TPA: DUF488 domain-containing protein [Kouleothrix sp.]|uniref:DUF488 domain-containing protein n=1 Tax=Kouleothrix sp. TaxID=2779161 RepID=UPI002CEF4E9B|nr:DUF488 domain-containing protein [Kouleothrix sp.]HRC76760.1 DUF488 domain-containing protein [Kouleothrix sp.]